MNNSMLQEAKLKRLYKKLSDTQPADSGAIKDEILAVIEFIIKKDAYEWLNYEERVYEQPVTKNMGKKIINNLSSGKCENFALILNLNYEEKEYKRPLTSMQDIRKKVTNRFLLGRCGDLVLILKSLFPMTECFSIHDGSHFYVMYDNLLFDAEGAHTFDETIKKYKDKHGLHNEKILIQKHTPSDWEYHGNAGFVLNPHGVNKDYIIPSAEFLLIMRDLKQEVQKSNIK